MFKYTIRKDGRLMKRVSVNGHLQTLYSNNVKDLENQYIDLKHLSNKGIAIENNSETIKNFSNNWLKIYKSDKEQATKNMYSDAIRLYIIPFLGDTKIKNIKESDIIELLNKLNKKPRQKEIVLLTIKQILDKAVDNDLIYKNVANKIKLKKHKAKEKMPLSDLEISYLQRVAKNDQRCFMVLFMLYTGIRKEEVAPLKYADIDIENKLLTINKAVHWEKNVPTIKDTKNCDIRKIPILDIIYNEIKELKNMHKNTELIFPAIKSKKIMSETSIRKVLEYVLKKINTLYEKDQLDAQKSEINKIKFTYHQLRHTYVCLLHKADIPLKEAQCFTGHRNLSVLLNIYTHLDNEDKQNATDKLNELIKA